MPSSPPPTAPDDGVGRLEDFPVAPVIPAPQLETPDPDNVDDEDCGFEYPDDDFRSALGHTPFEHLDFSDEDITHELTVQVDAPRSKCFQIWADRTNYLEWFDNIAQLIVHRQEPNLVSLFMLYQWGTTPVLELYTTLSRSQVEEDEVILEESVDGMDFVAGVIFTDAEEGSGTDVTLRLGYYLPEQLNEFVGPLAIYGDVNDILQSCMDRMKTFIETASLEELQSSRQAERQGVEQEFDTQQEKFHAEHGTVEEIYANAQDAAGDYLSQWEDSDEEGEDEEEEEGEWDDDNDIEYEEHDDDQDDDDQDDDDQEVADVDVSPQDFELSATALTSDDSQTTSMAQAQQDAAQTQPLEPGTSSDVQAQASEQQAAADMSSRHQQDVGQFDQAQALRISPDDALSGPQETQQQEEEQQLDLDLIKIQEPAVSAATANGDEQQGRTTKKAVGRSKTKSTAEARPKTPKKQGRPETSTADSAT